MIQSVNARKQRYKIESILSQTHSYQEKDAEHIISQDLLGAESDPSHHSVVHDDLMQQKYSTITDSYIQLKDDTLSLNILKSLTPPKVHIQVQIHNSCYHMGMCNDWRNDR